MRRSFGSAFPVVVLGLVVLVSLGVSLSGGFVWDDRPLITENRLVQDPSEIGQLLTSSFWETGDRHDRFRSFFRPVVSLSYALDYGLWGLRPFGFHLTNLFLHLLCCWLVYRVALDEEIATPAALFGAAVFAAHPAHAESVAWISGRTDLLCAVFLLAAYRAHRAAMARTPAAGLRIASLVLFVLALFSKEMAAVFPLLVFIDYWLSHDRGRRVGGAILAALPFGTLLAFYLLVRTAVLGPGGDPLFALTIGAHVATALFVLARYVTILIVPIGLDAHYPYAPIESLLSPLALLSGAMLLVISWAAWRSARREPRVTFWIGWVLVSFVPVLAFGRFGDVVMADRFLYIPSVGFAILVARGAARWMIGNRRHLSAILPAGVVLVLAMVSWHRSAVWKDDYTLFADMLETSPESALVHNNLGHALYERGDVDRAIDEFRQAVVLTPGYSTAHNNLGAALERLGHHDEALSHFRVALRLAPGLTEAAVNTGNLLVRRGRHEDGLRVLHDLVERSPRYPQGLYALADALYRSGRADEALPHLARARSLDPLYAEPHYLLGKILFEKGRVADAAESMRRFLELWPEDGDHARAARRIVARFEIP